MKRHPSGHPIRSRHVVRLPIARTPPDEPLVPGLRPGNEKTEAIGFIHHFPDEDDWDDEEYE